jgi:hypothetical protein
MKTVLTNEKENENENEKMKENITELNELENDPSLHVFSKGIYTCLPIIYSLSQPVPSPFLFINYQLQYNRHFNIGTDFTLTIYNTLNNNISSIWDSKITNYPSIPYSSLIYTKFNQSFNYTLTPFDIHVSFDEIINDLSINDYFNTFQYLFQYHTCWYFYINKEQNSVGILCHVLEALKTRTPFYCLHSGFLKIKDLIKMIEFFDENCSFIELNN